MRTTYFRLIMYFLRPSASRALIIVLLTTLIFSRLALANYVCPLSQWRATVSASQMGNTDCTQSSDHSKMIDEAQPNLCAQHFSDHRQVTNAVAQPLASEPVLFFAYALPPPLPSLMWQLAIPDNRPDSGGGDGTHLLLTLRLRI
ncbi:hypothetical protein [Candidimonas nitroreducens]|jgi:hypothetical protein|uniref:hypothetical protein n=1 Tax=Candidimonas nitroreducens TaxID=683354 RepID=UPI001178B349|nr:hypothetical protein [Candidimonas nitroreducens]